MNNRAQRQEAAVADNWWVNLVTSAADRQPDDDRDVCSVNFSKSNKTATALAKCDLKHCNTPLVKTAANTPLPHEAAIACQHFHALPFYHADNSIQHKSTFPSKEIQQNILIGYILPHDQNILTSQKLQLEHLAHAKADSVHELDELSHENLHLEKSLSSVFRCGHTVQGSNLINTGSPLRNAN